MGLEEEAVGVEEWRRKGGDLGGGPEEEAAGVEEEKRKGGAGRGLGDVIYARHVA